MNAKKSGLIIFLIAALYMIIMGWLASWSVTATLRDLTLSEVGQTIWAFDGVLFWIWALSVPLGAILAGVGILLYVEEKKSRVLLFGMGIFLTTLVIQFLPNQNHYPLIFGVGGGLILASFLAILWFWAKKRTILEGPAKTAADFQLVSYVFFLTAMWYLCGRLGGLFFKAFEGESTSSPLSIILFLVLGWLFLLLSHYKEAQAIQK